MAITPSADGGSRSRSTSRRTYGHNYRKAPIANAIAKAARTAKVSNARKAGTRRAVQAVQNTRPQPNNAAAAVKAAAVAAGVKKAAAAAALTKAANVAKARAGVLKASQAAKAIAAAKGAAKVATAAKSVASRPATTSSTRRVAATGSGGGKTATTKTAAVAAPVKPTTTVAKPAAPTTTTTGGTPTTAAKATTLSGRGTFGRFNRLRQNRGPMTGESLTPEQLQAIARQRIVNYH